MELLDAVNLVMPKLGERPVTSLERKHPTLAVLLPVLENTRKTMLSRGWWFNEYEYTAYPNAQGIIDIGVDCLSFLPHTTGEAVVRGQRLYSPSNVSFVFAAPVKGKIISDVPFEELPENAAQYVLYKSTVEAYSTDLGVTQELQVWQGLAVQAWGALLAEHLRQRRHSTRKSPRFMRLRTALRS